MTGYGPSIFFSNGTYNMPVVRALSRSYPQAVAGATLAYLFDSNTAQFQVRYTIDATLTQPTDIFICEDVHYPKGYTVTTVPANLVSWTSSKNHVFIAPISSSSHGHNVTVVIYPN